MFLTPSEAAALDAQVAAIESRTGVQVVTAIVGKSDTYVELPWKAFALGASLAAFVVVGADWWRPDWVVARTALLHAIAILGAGAAAALAAIFIPPFARIFLRSHRADVEVRQHAQSLFLDRDLVRTRERTAVLILVSLFERRIEIVADRGLRSRVTEADWHGVIARMTPSLRRRSAGPALEEALTAVEALLVERGFRPGGPTQNELPDGTIEERGA